MAVSENLIMAAANAAPRGVERLIRALAANETLLDWTRSVTERTVRRIKKLHRIAVVSDTNIGDAVVLQGACSTFKRWLPACEIDFFYQQKAHPLLRANPFIDHHQPVFTDADFTSSTNRGAVQAAIREREYDLVLNLYPFLMNSELDGAHCPVLVPYRLIAEIIRAEKHPTEKAHVAFQLHRYVDGVARILADRDHPGSVREDPVENLLYLPEDVPARADEILRAAGVENDARIAFLNPDSSSRFSRIPSPMQVELLGKLLDLDSFDRVLLGPAYSFVDIPDELCARVADHPAFRKLVRLPRQIPIDTYAALVDRANLFITADTAQMHIAAARRVTPGRGGDFRNRTALLTIFGATNSRIYGYDSFSDGYLDSSQDAPAKVFEGTPSCRNLTCIHKTRKTCRTVECFTGLNTAPIIEWIEQWAPRDADAVARSARAGNQAVCPVTAFPQTPVHSDQPEPIIVVSGLPRSGTSLMMQMLEAGGIPLATDGVRIADADNPRGYYELEQVKGLDRDASCLSECRGKAVKIISLLLSDLPAHHEYRIIFMERKLPEIMASQKRMLERRGTPGSIGSEEELAASFRRHLALVKQALADRPDVKTLYVSYHSIIESPLEIAAQVRGFLDQDLNLEDMVRAVDTKLYRNNAARLANASDQREQAQWPV
jgi:ADP-heptose:LPS heptosyltransferase